MALRLRHRHALAVPFVLLFVVTLALGLANDIDARGRVVDDMTGEPVTDATIAHGSRTAVTNEQGEFVLRHVPRLSRMQVRAPGYQIVTVDTTSELVELSPLSITFQVNEAGAEGMGVPLAQIRRGDEILRTVNETGNTVVSPHPGADTELLVCAEGYESKTVFPRGVRMIVELEPGGEGCPPLPTPSPAPSPTPGGSPSPSPSPEPSPTPSPTGE